MTENNGSGNKEEVSFDGVVDELRNVLSGLGGVAPASQPKAPPAPAPAPFDDPFSQPDLRSPFDKDVVRPAPPMNGNVTTSHSGNGTILGGNGNAAPRAQAAPAPPESLASDADFWNGNVLGWPSNGDADLSDVSSLGNATTEPAPADNGFLREDAVENGFSPMPAPVESDFDKIVAGDESNFLPPVPEPIENTPKAWPLLKEAEDVIPPPPLAPSASAAAPVMPPPAPVVKAPSADPWMRSGFGLDSPLGDPAPVAPPPASSPSRMPEFVIESADTTPPAPIAPMEVAPPPMLARPSADFEFELPIPGTKETKDPLPAASTHLELDGTEMKPRDLIQVACIYPEGQEKSGQTFVTKLREAAEKLRLPMTIQAVFVSAWAPDKIEPPAWGKSASLSGADVMFVLAFRASGNLFRGLAEVATKGGPKTRLVFLEQINFPTLYADILVELRRAR